MMKDIKSTYTLAGNDYDGALNRTAGDEELFLSLLDMFLNDKSWSELNAAMANGDAKAAFAAAHSLKGSSGMLGMTRLFDAVHPLTEALRGGDIALAKVLFPAAEREYEDVTELIKTL